jgi:glycosyltransferase involved in cell wall biosynthesis
MATFWCLQENASRVELMSKPTVSIILPTFNRAHVIGRSIRSLLDQTYRGFELIVVDDGSTDNTESVVKSFRDTRIRYLKYEPNRGAAHARNLGIQEARGQCIAFQDSDDEWLKDKLEKQIRVMSVAPPSMGIVYTGYWRVAGKQRTYLPSSDKRTKDLDIHNLLLKENFVTTQTVLLKEECLKKVGLFDERLPRLQDWELWLRVSKHYLFEFIDEPLVITYFQKDSITSKPDALINAFDLILQKYAQDFEKNQRALAHAYFAMGKHLLNSDLRTPQQRAYLREAARLDPSRIKFRIYALISGLSNNTLNRLRMIYRKTRSLSSYLRFKPKLPLSL